MIITAKKEDIFATKVGSLSLTHEKMFELQSNVVESFYANVTDYKRKPNNGQRYSFKNRGKFHSGGVYRGRGGRYNQNNQNRPQCQLCGHFHHVAMKCFNWFDHSFQKEYYSQTSAPRSNTTGMQAHALVGQPQALVATQDVYFEPLWFADSGASNNCTPFGEHL